MKFSCFENYNPTPEDVCKFEKVIIEISQLLNFSIEKCDIIFDQWRSQYNFNDWELAINDLIKEIKQGYKPEIKIIWYAANSKPI